MNTNSKLASQKTIKGQIADSSGHTDFEGNIEDAMKTIVEQVSSAGKWVYVNGTPFFPTNINDPIEQDELRNRLLDDENPSFTLTGKLQGGATTVFRSRTLKTPVSSVFNSKNRPQLAVVVKKNHGKTYVDIVSSDYKNSRAKLAQHDTEIIAGIMSALGTAPKPKATKKAKATTSRK